MLQREPLWQRARGQWSGILQATGVSAKSLVNKHGPCPICGGKDRFRFDDKDGSGSWICNQCGAGDGAKLVMLMKGCDFKEAAQLIEKHIGEGLQAQRNGRPVKTDGQKREEMTRLWKRSRPITLADHAGQYLNARTGLTAFPATLRFSPDERYADAGEKPSFHPAMVAKVDPSDAAVANGEKASLHRTYLTSDGSKADVASPRKMMGPMPSGAAVRLMEPGEILGIAEGIETAFSASALFDVPCWAALTAGLMQDWTPPEGVKHVYVFGDHDRSFAGQAAANTLAQRLVTKGIGVTVEIPPMPGTDWNDVHQRKRERELA